MIRSKHPQNLAQPSPKPETFLSEGGRSLRAEHLLAASLGNTVREREAQALLKELLDIGALDVLGLLDLNNTENLRQCVSTFSVPQHRAMPLNLCVLTWIDLKRAR